MAFSVGEDRDIPSRVSGPREEFEPTDLRVHSEAPHRVTPLALPWWKRSFDFIIAGSLLVAALPIIVMISAVSRRTLGSPILYRQKRGGLGGSTFEIIKFRTMTNATDSNGNLLPDDQRRHRWGNFLRRTSLDELPTLLNIVRGEMSVVGPRPLMAIYLDRYSPRESQRHRVTPGLTGMAQTRGRNLLDWSERFELDLEYIERRSVRTDLRILRDTVSIVLSREGADGNDHCTEFQGLRETSAAAPATHAQRAS